MLISLLVLLAGGGGVVVGWLLAQRVAEAAARLMSGRLILAEAALDDAVSRERHHSGLPLVEVPTLHGVVLGARGAAHRSIRAAKRREVEAQRHQVQLDYPTLFMPMLSVLYRHDPIHIASHSGCLAEYEPELRTILPRLSECTSAEAVRGVVFEEFCYWFGDRAGDEESDYDAVARDLWALWQAHHAEAGPFSRDRLASTMACARVTAAGFKVA